MQLHSHRRGGVHVRREQRSHEKQCRSKTVAMYSVVQQLPLQAFESDAVLRKLSTGELKVCEGTSGSLWRCTCS